MRIFIIEDDAVISKALRQEIEKQGLECQVAKNFNDVMPEFKSFDPHLAIIDINLPGAYNGYYWCSQIRASSQVPIIFISSADDKMNQMMAMQMGADDFISKPIDFQLATVKIQALLRRAYDFDLSSHQELTYQGIELNPQKAVLDYQGESVHLTFTELQILTVLFDQQENYVSRDDILDYCWQTDRFIDDNTLAVNISRLRSKLDQVGLRDLIETKKRVGYRIYLEEGQDD